MPNITVKALKVDQPGNSLAVWLAAHHPDLFLAAFRQAQAAKTKQGVQKLGLLGLGRLADDGITTTFDDSSAFSPSFAPVGIDPGLQSITFDTSSIELPDNLLSDATDSGAGFLSSLGSGITSAGTSVGGVLSSAGSGILSALGSVGSYLTSNAGLTNLTNLAKTYYGAQAASSQAQTQAAVVQAQISRAATGQPAAPITYTTNAQGQVVPVYATQTPAGAIYQPLTSQGIANLTPSSVSVFLSQYGIYIGLGVAAIVGLTYMRRG